MALRASSLQSTNTLAINREIGSQYDAILEVSKHLAEIGTLANEDISGLIDSLNDAKDFTGITVVTGETPSWDATNKVLTVPVEKGDAGTDGRGIADIELTSTVGLTKTYTINYTDATSSTFTVINGANGANGVAGKSVYQLWLDAGNVGTLNDFLEDMKGPEGNTGPQGIGIQGPAGIDGQDLTVEQISYDGNGVFTWQFSDGTSYVTPDLRGPQGATGQKGDKGDTGQGIHHIKGTSTTNPNRDFGTSPFKDTYTLYGDASETINLGFFVVANGVSDSMSMEVYDTNSNGIVDNSEKLGGELPEYYVNTATDQDIAGNKTFSSDITVQGNLVVNGTQTVVLGSDTTGNYVAGITQGTGINVSGTAAEGWNPTVSLTNVGIAGTYRSVATDAQGRVIAGTNPTTVSGYGLTDVYTKTENDTSLAMKVNSSEKGVANGIATLDTNGKVILTQIPDSVLGQLEYMGTWNLTTLPTATQKGQYWIASVSGNGYVVGDWAVWNGTAFDKVDNTDAVATVAGRTGNVVLTKSDVGLGNVDNTADSAKPVSTAQQTALNLKADIASPALTGIPTAPTAVAGTNTTQLATTAYVNAEIANDAAPKSHVGSTGAAHGNATTTIAGFMSSADKTKLDGIATGANNYSLPVASSTIYGGIKVDATAQTVAANAVTATASRTYAVQLDASGNALVNVPWVDNNTVYTHPTSGVAAGTYKSVTVNTAGHVTAGTNPTTLAGYGITDAATLASPTFTGIPAVPTAAVGTNTTQAASTAYVIAEINKIEEW